MKGPRTVQLLIGNEKFVGARMVKLAPATSVKENWRTRLLKIVPLRIGGATAGPPEDTFSNRSFVLNPPGIKVNTRTSSIIP